MQAIKYSISCIAAVLLPCTVIAEVWQCQIPSAKSQLYTNAPTSGDCKQHQPRSGSYSTVSNNYFDLRVEEIQERYADVQEPSRIPKQHQAFNVRVLADLDQENAAKQK